MLESLVLVWMILWTAALPQFAVAGKTPAGSADQRIFPARLPGPNAVKPERPSQTGTAANDPVKHNEIAVLELCALYFDAQLEYFAGNHDGREAHIFAQKIRSSAGKEDGLFWRGGGASGESPIGPLFARAVFNEEQPDGGPEPYFGYFFKVLPAQGPSAPGGAHDYREGNGFALAAWPAAYGVTGRLTFLLSHAGEIWHKDLGPDTVRVAAGLTAFNPDRSWTRIPVERVP